MSEETSKDRSPKAPANSLEDCVTHLRRLHLQIGRSPVAPEVAAKALGYSGLTGSSLTLIASLTQYGFISREKGNVSITPLSLRVLHPTSQNQLSTSIKEAALSPKVFLELYNGYNECAEEVLASHLVQNGFTPDRAKRVAAVYTANKAFSKLDQPSIIPESTEDLIDDASRTQPAIIVPVDQGVRIASSSISTPTHELAAGHNVLAKYNIPLGANQATLLFTGEELTTEDFDALIDFVEFSKRQFVRASKRGKTDASTDVSTGQGRAAEVLD